MPAYELRRMPRPALHAMEVAALVALRDGSLVRVGADFRRSMLLSGARFSARSVESLIGFGLARWADAAGRDIAAITAAGRTRAILESRAMRSAPKLRALVEELSAS